LFFKGQCLYNGAKYFVALFPSFTQLYERRALSTTFAPPLELSAHYSITMNHLSEFNVEMLEDLLSSVDSFTTIDFAQLSQEQSVDSLNSKPPADLEYYDAGNCRAFCTIA